jgi:anti-sigma regulatory factor (Ser/Thr protein kinase)
MTPWVDRFLQRVGASQETAFGLHLCLEEAVSNIIRHGGPLEDGIRVTLCTGEGGVLARIEDDGPPFDPSEALPRRPPASLDDALPGGFGLPLMRGFASQIRYERVGSRNRLLLLLATSR